MGSDSDADPVEIVGTRGLCAQLSEWPRRRIRCPSRLDWPRKRETLAQRCIGHLSPEARRYRERSTVERVNGRLKDEFGGRHVRVRGPGKVMCHLMFGILALTVEQLMRLIL